MVPRQPPPLPLVSPILNGLLGSSQIVADQKYAQCDIISQNRSNLDPFQVGYSTPCYHFSRALIDIWGPAYEYYVVSPPPLTDG